MTEKLADAIAKTAMAIMREVDIATAVWYSPDTESLRRAIFVELPQGITDTERGAARRLARRIATKYGLTDHSSRLNDCYVTTCDSRLVAASNDLYRLF